MDHSGLEELFIIKRCLEREAFGFQSKNKRRDYYLELVKEALELPASYRHDQVIAAVTDRISEISDGAV